MFCCEEKKSTIFVYVKITSQIIAESQISPKSPLNTVSKQNDLFLDDTRGVAKKRICISTRVT